MIDVAGETPVLDKIKKIGKYHWEKGNPTLEKAKEALSGMF